MLQIGSPRSRRTPSTRSWGLGCALAAALIPAQAAQAAIYRYTINGGQFTTNTGPDSKGRFTGSFLWDTTANSGAGAYTEWQLEMYSPSNQLLYSFIETAPGAGCFVSPLLSGTNAAGAYSSSGPGGSACGNPNSLAIYQNVPYAYNAGGAKSGPYSFFRLELAGTVGNLSITSTQAGKDYVGWSVMQGLPTSPSCTGSNAYPPAVGACPFAGNQQNNQNINAGIAITTTNELLDPPPSDPEPLTNISPRDAPEVPGPLPLLGGAAAFSWSRRLRRRLRATSAARAC